VANTAKTAIAMDAAITSRMNRSGRKPFQPFWRETPMHLDLKLPVSLPHLLK